MAVSNIDSELLRLLWGKYRHAYAALLSRLHAGLFSHDVTDQPTKPEVTRDLAEGLEDWKATLEPHEAEAVHLTASDAYAELVSAGWLTEQREGWATYVEMERRAARVLEALFGPDDVGETFGGTMVSVLSNLEAARRDPDRSAQGLVEAARRAREFARHVRSVVGTLKAIEKAMLQEASINGLVRAFFDDFVSRVVIRDYGTLTLARNHPYGFKWRILDLADEISSDADVLSRLQNCLVEQGACNDRSAAAATVSRCLRDISASLDAIESFRHRIDLAKTGIERRFANTLRYMDSVGAGSADRFAGALTALGAAHRGVAWRGDDEIEIVTGLLQPFQTFDSARSVQPQRPRTPVEIQRFRQPDADPILVAFDRAKADFDRRLTITPERLMDYVRDKLRGKKRIRAADIPPNDIEELVVFSVLRATPGDHLQLPGGLIMRSLPGMVENEWMSCGDFVIEREKTGKGGEHAG